MELVELVSLELSALLDELIAELVELVKLVELVELDALKEVANGNSTKIFMPTELTQIVSSLGVAGEVMGLGDAMYAKKKPAPKAPIIDDDCIDRHESDISRGAAYTGAVIEDELKQNGLNLNGN